MALFEIETHDGLWTVAASLLLFLTALIIVIIFSSYLIGEKWNQHHSLQIPESGVTMAIGIAIGGILRLCSLSNDNPVESNLVAFAPALFFLGFLPPIIFNEGHHLDTAMFFAYLTPILIFVFLGTAVSTIIVAVWIQAGKSVGIAHEISFAESVAFGGMISATDPVAVLSAFTSLRVEPTLFFLVFGEAVLNDAVALTIFTIASKFVGQEQKMSAIGEGVFQFFVIVIASTAIGIFCGLAMAFALKTTAMRKTRVLELALYCTLVFYPYMLAQVVGMSGIVAVLVAGITAKHYAYDNLSSDEERDLAEFLFRFFAFLTDNATFLYLGFAFFGVKINQTWNPLFILWTLVACLVGRAGAVYGLSGLINLAAPFTHGVRISWRTQTVMWFAGLRGAVAFAAATNFPDALGNRDLIVTTTMAIIVVFTFVVSAWTVPLIRFLKVPHDIDYRTVRIPDVARFYRWCGSIDKKLMPFLRRKVASGELVEIGVVSLHRPRHHSGVPDDLALEALREAAEQYEEDEFPLEPFDYEATLHAGLDLETRRNTIVEEDVESAVTPPASIAASTHAAAAAAAAAAAVPIDHENNAPAPASATIATTAPVEHVARPPELEIGRLQQPNEDTLTQWIEQSIYDFGGTVSPRQPAAIDIISHASRHRPRNSLVGAASQHRRGSANVGYASQHLVHASHHRQVGTASQHRAVGQASLHRQQQQQPHVAHTSQHSVHSTQPPPQQHVVGHASQHAHLGSASQHRRRSISGAGAVL